MSNGWVGVDLDGTLAVYDNWQGIEHIGEPIPDMIEYVKALRAEGVEVRIFTARVQEGEEAIKAVQFWCYRQFREIFPVTDQKDFDMVFCVDDRAVTVEKNTGRFLVNPPPISAVAWHHSKKNPENPEYVSET